MQLIRPKDNPLVASVAQKRSITPSIKDSETNPTTPRSSNPKRKRATPSSDFKRSDNFTAPEAQMTPPRPISRPSGVEPDLSNGRSPKRQQLSRRLFSVSSDVLQNAGNVDASNSIISKLYQNQREEIADMKILNKSHFVIQEKKLAAIESSIEKTNEQHRELTLLHCDEITTKSRHVSALKEEISSIQGNLDAKHKEIQELVKYKEDRDDEISKLKNGVAVKEREVEKLKREQAQNFNDLKALLTQKNQEISRLKQYKTHEEELKTMEKEYRRLKDENGRLIDENKKLKDSHNESTKTITDLSNTIEDIIPDMNELLSQHRVLESTTAIRSAIAKNANVSMEKATSMIAKIQNPTEGQSRLPKSTTALSRDSLKDQNADGSDVQNQQTTNGSGIAPPIPTAPKAHGYRKVVHRRKYDHYAPDYNGIELSRSNGHHHRPIPGAPRSPSLTKDDSKEDNQSVTAPRKRPTDEMIEWINRGGFCCAYHLHSNCQDVCPEGLIHGGPLNKAEKETLRYLEGHPLGDKRTNNRLSSSYAASSHRG